MNRKLLSILVVAIVFIVAVAAYLVIRDNSSDSESRSFRLGDTLIISATTTEDDGSVTQHWYVECVKGFENGGTWFLRNGTGSLQYDGDFLTRYVDDIEESLGTEMVDSPIFGMVEAEKYSVHTNINFQGTQDGYIWIYDGMVIQWTEDRMKTICTIQSMTCFDDDPPSYDVDLRTDIVPGDFIGYTIYNYTSLSAGTESYDTSAFVALSVDGDNITAIWTHDGSVVQLTTQEFLRGGLQPTGESQEVISYMGKLGHIHSYEYDNCTLTIDGLLLSGVEGRTNYTFDCSSLYSGTGSFFEDVSDLDFDTGYASYFVLSESGSDYSAISYEVRQYNESSVRIQSIDSVHYFDYTSTTHPYSHEIHEYSSIVTGAVLSDYIIFESSTPPIGFETINTTYGRMNCSIYTEIDSDSITTLWVSETVPGLIMKATIETEDSTTSCYLFESTTVKSVYA